MTPNKFEKNPITGATLISESALRSAASSSNPLVRFWYGLSEPRVITVAMTLAYAFSVLFGIWQLSNHPPHVSDGLNEITKNLVGWCFLSGFIGVYATLRGNWQMERAVIYILITGFSVHLMWAIFDPSPGVRWGQIFRIVLCIVLFINRHALIRWARLDPER